ncbi:hypothetical protein [Treponema socranskii]|uniref:hypothetical protein n=1 Tax=Treponema socranskii TaxID=53419 RepID=UPI0023F0DE6B|nr:hypothetical protein [Treponema socranskii]
MKPFCAAFILCCLLCAGRAFGAGSAERKPALGGRTVQGSDALQSAASGENASSEGGNEKTETKEMSDTAQTADVKSPDADGSERDAIDRFSRDAEGKLKAFAFEAERFTLSDVNGESVTVNASGEKAVRKTYDALMRLVKRDVWKIALTAKESVRESSETFYYNADRTYPASSVAESEGRRSETLYDDEGRAISFTEFFVDKDGTRIPDMKMVRRYTDGNKILEEEKSRWEYTDEKKTRLSAIRVQKKTYDYAAGGENPNYCFYEDGKLRIKTIYAQNDAYVTTLYFDDGYTVISEYAAGEKIRETIKHGDRVLRTKKYDTKN